MDKITFEEFLANTSPTVNIGVFIIDLIITALLCFLLSRIFVRWGRSLSNRETFAQNFILIGMTTMIIITVVKSSLALSLGLVGALSIVRFRTPIKEPEELAYLFITIAIGLGLGAQQRLIIISGFIIIAIIIVLKYRFSESLDEANLYISINSSTDQLNLEQIVSELKTHSASVDLKRYDEANGTLDASFLVDFRNFEQMIKGKDALQNKGDSVKITFVDNAGIL